MSNFKRKAKYYLAIFPFFGRNNYERLNSRLERQIKIREEKRSKMTPRKKSKLLFPNQGKTSLRKMYFDS
jgi:hypothetical protein